MYVAQLVAKIGVHPVHIQAAGFVYLGHRAIPGSLDRSEPR